jgi:hypothetical protein
MASSRIDTSIGVLGDRVQVPTLADCAHLTGLDLTKISPGPPTAREVRIISPLLRSRFGVWLPHSQVKSFITLATIHGGLEETFFSIPTQYVEGASPLSDRDIQELSAKIDAQMNAAIERMQKTIASDLASLFTSSPLFERLSGAKPRSVGPPQAVESSLKAEDFDMPPFQFGFSGFKKIASVSVTGTFLGQPFMFEDGFSITFAPEPPVGIFNLRIVSE